MGETLTKAQRELLMLAAQGELEISMLHPEAETLDKRGLLAIGGRILKGGSILFGRSAKITSAGRAALASATGEG